MLGHFLLALLAAAGLAVLLACCCKKPKKLPAPEDSDPGDQDPPYGLRTRPTRPAIDHSIYLRY